jgi:nucleotide-binding universal stress UspA family protein
MRREHRTNRLGEQVGRPPPAAVLSRWPADRVSPAPGEEVGLTLTPPSRYRSLVVPLDGSPFGEHALPLALAIARRAGASVRLVHVHSPLESSCDPGRLYPDGALDAWRQRSRREYLDGLLRRLERVAAVPVTPVLTQGREVPTSLAEAAGATDLVVMATHGRGPLGRLWHGSVADALLRRVTAPLLLVRGHEAPADLTGDPAVRHVLIPLDGSAASEQALGPALDLGALTGAGHTLLRVIRSAPDWSVACGRWPADDGGFREAMGYLRRLSERLGGPARKVRARLVRGEEPPAAAILRHARRHDADLIALTTRGRGALSRLFRGSVADRVVRGADVPVLVVRTAE